MVCFLLIKTAPLAKHVVTIIGSISGVKPTATEIANSDAATQSPLVKPLIINTMGTITSINLISTQLTALTPFAKLVWGSFSSSARVMLPKSV
ncbi:Uncharacterised protein [Chlamydia trachomatis]|nr:Uncharacterised protein [Chlamydia trachomatis]